MARVPNPEQQAAIEARGRVFLSAGAGTGKTSVLVERFVRAVCDEGLDIGSILVITYTKRAAGELRASRTLGLNAAPTTPTRAPRRALPRCSRARATRSATWDGIEPLTSAASSTKRSDTPNCRARHDR